MDNRLLEIFRLVCQSNREFTVRELAQQFSVSSRTIYSDIKKLNELLEASGYPEINADKGKMFYKSPLMIEFKSLIHSTRPLFCQIPESGGCGSPRPSFYPAISSRWMTF
uniref:HTH domain-containing protein n=1 Tax=Clostridium sp. NkU-1 TaxID=1095009 RepID=UPI0006D222F2